MYAGFSTLEPETKVDVSQCEALKYLSVCNTSELEFGTSDSRVEVDISDGRFSDPIEMGSLSKLESVHFYRMESFEFFIDKTSLKSFGCEMSDIESLDISNAPLLEDITLDFNNSLKELDCSNCNISILNISLLPALETLNCSGNRISDTSHLEEWLAQPGHSGQILPQRVD